MSEWREYTGSDEQIAAIKRAFKSTGYIVRFTSSGEESEVINDMTTSLDWWEGDAFTHYLICEPHPLADMIIRQVQTGQPVWVKRKHVRIGFTEETTWVKYIYDEPTSTPYWNIPGANYSFRPFQE